MTDLVITPQDYVDILNLYSALNLSSDEGDSEWYASCFTEDGVLHGTHEVKGRVALAAWKQKDKASRMNLYRRHWNGSLHLEKVDADTIRGRCYLLAYNGTPGQYPEMTHVGVYTDTIKREGGRWRFADRRLRFDAAPPK